MNTTQAQQKALNDALLALVDRLEFGKCNMGLKTDIKPKEATFQVVLDALALTPFYRAFLITADVPAIYMKEFWATDSVHTDLGYTGDITYLTDVNVDYLHQPWRAFATVINKCLSGKETGMDKIRLSRETRCFGTLLEMTPFTSMRCISRHEDTQAYGTILPKELTNQAMLESNAYKTYYAFASGEKAPKPKYVPKKADPDTSPKQKPIQATKGDGVDTQSKVPDEQQQKSSSTDEGTDEDNENDSNDRSDECDYYNGGNDGNDGDDDDANDDDKQEGDDTNDDDEGELISYDEEEENIDDEEYYLGFEQVEEDAHVTLTSVLDIQKADEPVQSSFVSSDFTSKLLNLENPSQLTNENASLMDVIMHGTTTLFPSLLDFASVFKFNERVFNLEKDVSEIRLLTRQEAQDEKNAYIELVDTSMRALIKEEVNTQLPQILPQAVSNFANLVIDKNVIESVEVAVLTRYMEKNKSYDKADYKKKLYDALRSQDERDKDRDPSVGSDWGTKRRKLSKDAESSSDSRSKDKKSLSTSNEAAQSQHKSSGKSAHAEETSHTVEDSCMQQDQEFVTGDSDEQPTDKEVNKADWFKKPKRPPTPDPDWNLEYLKGGDLSRQYSTSVTKTKAATYELKWIEDLEEIEVRQDDQKLYTFKEQDFKRLRLQDIEDMLLLLVQQRLTNLTIDECDGTLNDVRSALHDIATGIRMEYLTMRKWSNLDKKRARVMV
ncbi:hypothetical protein Tco_0640129 [Tanacetum coccineum]